MPNPVTTTPTDSAPGTTPSTEVHQELTDAQITRFLIQENLRLTKELFIETLRLVKNTIKVAVSYLDLLIAQAFRN